MTRVIIYSIAIISLFSIASCEIVANIKTINDAGRVPPSKRFGMGCEFIDDKMLVYGGMHMQQQYSNALFYYDTIENEWVWTNSKMGFNYNKSKIEAPAIRGQSMNRIGSHVYVFGGRAGGFGQYYSNYIYKYDPDETLLSPVYNKTDGPAQRQGHSTVVLDDRYLIVYGGSKELVVHDDVWAFDTLKLTWTQLPSSSFRSEGHRAVIKESVMYVFGGFFNRTFFDHVQMLYLDKNDLGNSAWTTLKVSGDRPKAYFTANLVGDQVYILGGVANGAALDDISVFNIKDKKWLKNPTTSGDKFFARQSHCTVVDKSNNRLLIFGGYQSQDTKFQDLLSFELTQKQEQKYDEL
ncbi:acyl-CoA-binding domain-containing protein [Acrasis kona]|uniref:Acyl-CoA-binding domain-containing protein n=1 Tax=Acrasis kona TaxID=1008807 RepID=A0AAW2YYT0_9EUKA